MKQTNLLFDGKEKRKDPESPTMFQTQKTMLLSFLIMSSTVLCELRNFGEQTWDVKMIAILAGLLGLVIAFVGIKLFKPALAIFGIAAAGCLAYVAVDYLGDRDMIPEEKYKLIMYISCAVAGFLGAALVLKITRIAFFLAAIVGGGAIGLLLLDVLGDKISSHFKAILVFTCCLVMVILVIFYEDILIIGLTSVFGSFLFIMSISALTNSDLYDNAETFIDDPTAEGKPMNKDMWWIVIGWVVLSTVSALVQYKVQKKRSSSFIVPTSDKKNFTV